MSWILNRSSVIMGTLHHPAERNWSAQVQVIDEVQVGTCTLQLPGLTLTGTIVEAGTFGGRTTAEIVGGAGKLAEIIDGQHFRQATGRAIADVLLQAAGEQLDPASSATGLASVLQHWAYLTGPAGVALDRLCFALGCSWWMTAEGLVHLGELAYDTADPEGALVLDVHADMRRLDVALEQAALLPRTSYSAPAPAGTVQITAVDHAITPQAWRAHAWYTAAAAHPFDGQLAELVQHFQLRTIPPLDAQVVSQGGDGSLVLRLSISEQQAKVWGIPNGLQDVPLALLGGLALKLAPEARVRLDFLDNDVQKPIASYLSGTILEASLSAQAKVALSAAAVDLADALKPVVRVGDVLAAGLSTPAGGGAVSGTIAIAPPVSKVKA